MEKRIAIVFSDVIREIYKMRGGKVVNSNDLENFIILQETTEIFWL